MEGSKKTREKRYRCGHGHEWTTRPNIGGIPMKCPHCGTVTLGQVTPFPDVEDRLAAVLWQWNTEHPLGPPEGFPYDRLIEPTKDDLRRLARRLVAACEADRELVP